MSQLFDKLIKSFNKRSNIDQPSIEPLSNDIIDRFDERSSFPITSKPYDVYTPLETQNLLRQICPIDNLHTTTGSGFRHIRNIERSTDGAIVRDAFESNDGVARPIRLFWAVSGLVDIVIHGQGAEVFHGNRKIFDFILHSSTSTTVKHLSQPTLSAAYPQIHSDKHSNAEALTYFVVETHGSKVDIKTIFSYSAFNYVDRSINRSNESWGRFNGGIGLNYLLKRSRDFTKSKFLVVGFSSVREPGDFTYNYKATVDEIGPNALYILDDFGDQGAYYLMDHGDTSIRDSVQALIRQAASELGISPKNIIMIGSSKGGAAAIIHGLEGDVGHIYVGAPQTKIGTFVSVPHPNILEFMTGSVEENAIDFLDSYMFDQIIGLKDFPTLTIIVGKADHHYKRHVLPFVEHAAKHGWKINVGALDGVPHSEIGPVYRRRLVKYLTSIIK